MSLLSEVEATLSALDLDVKDAAAAALAREYAAAIDALDVESRPRLIGTIGPSLLRCLESLGATPAARGKLPDREAPATVGVLAALRATK